jgi:hypothetical protein
MSMPSRATATADRPEPAPAATHGCVRCGATIPIEDAMCERCNPLGLRQPAASQAHGIAILAMSVAVIVLAVVARVATVGVGPFRSEVTSVAATGDGLRVGVSITNDGSTASSTSCRIARADEVGIGPTAAFIQSPSIGAGETVAFETVVRTLGTQERALAITCGGR